MDFPLKLSHVQAASRSGGSLFFSVIRQMKYLKLAKDFSLLFYIFIYVCRISLEILDAELQRLRSRMRALEESVRTDCELLQQLDSFLQVALTCNFGTPHTTTSIKNFSCRQ